MSKLITIRVDDDVPGALAELAEREGGTRNESASRILRQALVVQKLVPELYHRKDRRFTGGVASVTPKVPVAQKVVVKNASVTPTERKVERKVPVTHLPAKAVSVQQKVVVVRKPVLDVPPVVAQKRHSFTRPSGGLRDRMAAEGGFAPEEEDERRGRASR